MPASSVSKMQELGFARSVEHPAPASRGGLLGALPGPAAVSVVVCGYDVRCLLPV